MDDNRGFHSRRPWLPYLVALGLMAGLGVLVVWQWQELEANNRREQEQRFSIAVDDVQQSVTERMRAYEMVLRGMAGLLAGSDQVSAEEWMRATDQLQLQDRYPGIQSVAWARYLRGPELAAFVDGERAEGRKDFRVFPSGERDEYLIADYISPLDWRNRRGLGFDVLSEELRRKAVYHARRSGEAVLSAPLRLKSETDEDTQVGAVLYMPVYANTAPVTSEEERQQAFVGAVTGAFRMQDLLEGILGSRSELYQVELVDNSDDGGALLSGGYRGTSAFQLTRAITVFGREWQMTVSSTQQYERRLENPRLQFNLWVGLLASVLLGLMVGGYLLLRERAVANIEALSAGLREREERFRLVVEASPNAIVLVDSNGRIAMVNQQAELMFGYPRDELVGAAVEKLLPESLRHAHVGMRQAFQKAPEPRQMGGNRELFAQHKDGHSIPVEVGLSPLRSGPDVLVQAVIIDISTRKAAEERFRLVVEASPNAIVLVDNQGRIAMANRQTEQLFGYPRGELLGQAVEKLLPDSLQELHVGLRKSFLRSPEPRQMGNNRELFGRHQDGHLIPLEVGLSPLRSGEDVLVQAVIIDISERKAAETRLREQAEQLALANRYKSEFLANMSHELRTPLNSILILSEQLKQNNAGNLNEKQVKHSDIIHRAGRDLLQLINDVLDLARIEAGRVQLKMEQMNVHDLMQELDASLRPMAELKGLRLITALEPQVPRVIFCDRGRLQQIVRNLLSNALKFTERGEVELAVSCLPVALDDGRQMLKIVVRDTGIGIAAEQHQRVFQAFQQIDGSTSRAFGGTGLGLAITRQLVEVLEGTVRLDSAPGQGSSFTVELPVAVVPSTRVSHQPAAGGFIAPVRTGQGPALLVVEDDLNFAGLIAEEAQAHGFASVHCRSGNQAIELLQREQFAAVILDILLPDISGWQIYRSLRGQPQHRGMPVHIISCVPQPDDWHDDGTRYLVKPIARADLEQVFTDLARHEHEEQNRLLLVEDIDPEREFYREHLSQLGFTVTAVATAEQARNAYHQDEFAALVVDLNLPDQDGFDLIELMARERPLSNTRVVVNTGVDVTQQSLQRLRRYSAVVVQKNGQDLQALSLAVQGFLSSVREPQPPAVVAPINPLQDRRVLLVDDDVRNIYAMSALLDELGLEVTTARDGFEAFAAFAEQSFDLILMDMAMPNMDGYTATRLLKQEKGCTVPIIALTAHAMKGDREKCLAAGTDDYLAKPVARQDLKDLLQRWLAKSEGRNGSSTA
ncbi:MAG: PAS domain S-box protein [Pseudomonas sp.]|uniref:PAS domain S-box protein n=1 Tax=Pseudomonas sp. TaxID=306 RepID=UPI0030F34F5C